MKKMNKKGFTLIEMLVVIAIIAILVAIIIPTVMSSTDKAEASTIAANLRSLKAEISTSVLTKDGPWASLDLKTADVTKAYADLTADQKAAVTKALGNDIDESFQLIIDKDTQTFTVKCGDKDGAAAADIKTIDGWAKAAGGETGTAAATAAATTA